MAAMAALARTTIPATISRSLSVMSLVAMSASIGCHVRLPPFRGVDVEDVPMPSRGGRRIPHRHVQNHRAIRADRTLQSPSVFVGGGDPVAYGSIRRRDRGVIG